MPAGSTHESCSEKLKTVKLLPIRCTGVKLAMEDLRSLIQAGLDNNGQLSCEEAYIVAEARGVNPQAVRQQADNLGIRISRCQLGLFGYAPEKGRPGFRAAGEAVRGSGQKTEEKMEPVPEKVATAVGDTCSNNEITCVELWELGRAHNVSRFDMGCLAESLELSVRRCQLGCF